MKWQAYFKEIPTMCAIIFMIVVFIYLLKSGSEIRPETPWNVVISAVACGVISGAIALSLPPLRHPFPAIKSSPVWTKSNTGKAVMFLALFTSFFVIAMVVDIDHERTRAYRGAALIDLFFIHRSHIVSALVKMSIY